METLGSLKGDFVLDGELVAFDQEPPGSPEKEFPSDALIISASANLSKWVPTATRDFWLRTVERTHRPCQSTPRPEGSSSFAEFWSLPT